MFELRIKMRGFFTLLVFAMQLFALCAEAAAQQIEPQCDAVSAVGGRSSASGFSLLALGGQAQPTGQSNNSDVTLFAGFIGCVGVISDIPEPTNVVAVRVSPTQIDLTWKNNAADADSFRIFRANFTGGQFIQVGTNTDPTDTTFSDTTVDPNIATYIYTITVKTPAGLASSDETPQPPKNCKAAAESPSRIRVSWDDNSPDEEGFKIWRTLELQPPFPPEDSIDTIISADPGDMLPMSYADDGLLSDKTYYYAIFSYIESNKAGCINAMASTSNPTITLILPNGGETWQIGSTETIQWTSSDVSGNVKIEISRDGGASYSIIASSTANDESFDWTVTGSATSQARIRISSVTDASINDRSNNNFTITPNPTITPVVTTVTGDNFRVDIQVTGVTDLFGISFNLVYTTDRPEVLALGVETDPFIGTDLVFVPQITNSTKTVSVGISRKAGQGGVSGDGTVAKINFQGNLNAPEGTTVGLELQDVTANDPSGNAITFTVTSGDFVTDIESLPNDHGRIPDTFELSQNYPNPFNPVTSINFQIPKLSHVVLKIYDILGNEVRTLINEEKPAGVYKVVWNGKDERGKQQSSGIYFYKLQADDFTAIKKMLFVQ